MLARRHKRLCEDCSALGRYKNARFVIEGETDRFVCGPHARKQKAIRLAQWWEKMAAAERVMKVLEKPEELRRRVSRSMRIDPGFNRRSVALGVDPGSIRGSHAVHMVIDDPIHPESAGSFSREQFQEAFRKAMLQRKDDE